jgi:hypothetical protein
MLQKERQSKNDTYNRIINAEKMTPDKLKLFPGFEEIEENQAKQIIETLENYCGIIVKHIAKKKEYG